MRKENNNMLKKQKYPIITILLIFVLCLIPHYIEVLYLRTEESFLADNFINKIVGIVILAIALKQLHYSWSYIGFRQNKLKYLFVGLAVGFSCYLVAYGAEYVILMIQNQSPKFEMYVSGFSLTGNLLKQTGLITYLLCFLFNIINVVMEEGVFRGLFIRLGEERWLFTKANCFAAFLFGLWHLSMPVKSFIDKEINLSMLIIMGLGYIFLAFLMGIKWGLWFRNTNCLWFGIAEHFFNNTITNLLHLTTSEGSDTLQFLRILIAQLLSLLITLFINNRYKKGLFKFE